MIQIRFGDNFIYLETNKLIPSKELLENVKRSHKYHQIVTSIESLGIIEPIIVFYDKDKDVTKILDGHLRVEALKDLGIEKAPCILSSIDDAFTSKEGANKQVISSQADSLIKISRIWADFFPANTSNQPI